MSNVLRLHKRDGTRIRLVRVDSPYVIDRERVGAHEQSGEKLPRLASSATPQQGMVCSPVDEQESGSRLRNAYEQGRADGRADTERAVQQALACARSEADERIGALMEGIARQIRAFTAALEQDAYKFAMSVAERIIKREIARDDEAVVRQVRDALRRIVGVETVKLRIHPDDEILIRSHRGALLASADTIREVAFEPDDTIERGGCIIESSSGNVDARIATQLRQIDNALFAHEATPREHIP